jgi:disulfide bond formation protein DsbB
MEKFIALAFVLLLVLVLGLTACGGSSEPERAAAPASQGDAAKGEELFLACSVCHGQKGEGVPGLGKDMAQSEFIAGKTDEELVEFIKVGRTAGDELNTTGVDMPPMGGNPSLSDEDLYHIVAYMRSLQK